MNNFEKQAIFIKRTQEKYPFVWDTYCNLVKHERMTRDELADFNFRKRKELVKFVYDNTVFYRKLYASVGVTPDDIKTEEDWNHLPTVTKADLRDHFSEFIVGGVDGEIARRFRDEQNTGGSTGRPLHVYRDNRFPITVLDWRLRGWLAGYEPGTIAGMGDKAILGVNEGWVCRVGSWKLFQSKEFFLQKMELYKPMRKFFLDALKMKEADKDEFINAMVLEGISYIHGYAGAVEELAKHILAANVCFRMPPFAVTVTSTPLSMPARNLIERAFNCVVGDIYGSNEVHWVAAQCCTTSTSMHYFSDIAHLDILDDYGNAIVDECEGWTCITSFENHVMPLVRYRLNDRTHWVKEHCHCGLPFPRIASVKGRESDYLLDNAGKKVFGFNASFDSYPDSVLAYQFAQSIPGEAVLKVVPNTDYSQSDHEIEMVCRELNERLAGRLHFCMEKVKQLPHDGGKIRFIIHE